MTTIAVIAVALCGALFFGWHIVVKVVGYKEDKDRKSEIETVRKELEDECLKGGNVARIAQLRARLLVLRGK